LNESVFLLINAGSVPNPLVLNIALFFSKILPYLVMAASALAFIFGGRQQRRYLLIIAIAASGAALLSWLIGYFAYSPRPFIDSVGELWLAHRDTASFPSNHALFISIFAATYLIFRQWLLGGLFLVLALGISWSRVYLGVHYPLDIVGGVVLGVLVALCVAAFLRPVLNLPG